MRTAALLAGVVCLAAAPGAALSAGAPAAAPPGPGAAASAASSSAPSRATVATHELRLVDGQVATGSRLLAALKGDALRWRITSNRPGQLHLHAYRLSVAVVPGQAAELAFVAHATGRFRIEWHAADAAATAAGQHHAAPLAMLEVRPP